MLPYIKLKMKTLISSIFLLSLLTGIAEASDVTAPITLDSRIKTFIYSDNEIFPVVLNLGYQTAIEFSKDETIQTYSVGNQFVWQFSAVGRTLFIKPLEENIVTNMTVITNKRRYYFELYSRKTGGMEDEEISYVVRFFYPEGKELVKVEKKEEKKSEQIQIQPYNFNYSFSQPISLVFDNGIGTFIKVPKPNLVTNVICDGEAIKPRIIGSYLMVTKICKKLTLSINGKNLTIQAK
jgi:type IV secretion system protein VirB9